MNYALTRIHFPSLISEGLFFYADLARCWLVFHFKVNSLPRRLIKLFLVWPYLCLFLIKGKGKEIRNVTNDAMQNFYSTRILKKVDNKRGLRACFHDLWPHY